MQLWESTQMLGSEEPLDPGRLIVAAKVTGAGPAGGWNALVPPVCFVYQAFVTQLLGLQLVMEFGKAILALPCGSSVMVKYSSMSRLARSASGSPVQPRPLKQME